MISVDIDRYGYQHDAAEMREMNLFAKSNLLVTLRRKDRSILSHVFAMSSLRAKKRYRRFLLVIHSSPRRVDELRGNGEVICDLSNKITLIVFIFIFFE